MGSLRTFIAIDIPPAIKQSIQQITDQLRKQLGASFIRWTSANSLHLTLKFLGDTSPASVELLRHIIQSAADAHPVFDLPLASLGSFPNLKRVRVLFIGTQPPAELEALYREVESACKKIGYKAEAHPFSPHLTIGRVKEQATPAERQKLRTILEATKIDSLGQARVDSIYLYKSELKPNGAVYTKIFSAPLNQRGET